MALIDVALGTSPDGAGGDTNREAFQKVNDNFALFPLGIEGLQVKLVYRSVNTRWEYPDGTVPTLTGRVSRIVWEGTSAQVPAQGTGDGDFQEGDTALVRSTSL